MNEVPKKWTSDQIYDKILAGESILALHVDKTGFEIILVEDAAPELNLIELFGDHDAES